MSEQIFGEIHGVTEGQTFRDRQALMDAKIHRVRQAGIDGNPAEGSSSIVLNGGFVDDYDLGDVIIYTGHGANDPNTNRQIGDQDWDATGNKALLVSELNNLPVRVTRGYKHRSEFSPKEGYRYGGIYYVVGHFEGIGKDGFRICRYKLVKDGKLQEVDEQDFIEIPKGKNKPERVKSTVDRIVRDTAMSKSIKKLYNYTCQVCSTRIAVRDIGYAEGAHIRPLGRDHKGSDTSDNLICLCPNHHVMLDKGIYSINDDFTLIGIGGTLSVHKKHIIDLENLAYHRDHIFIND